MFFFLGLCITRMSASGSLCPWSSLPASISRHWECPRRFHHSSAGQLRWLTQDRTAFARAVCVDPHGVRCVGRFISETYMPEGIFHIHRRGYLFSRPKGLNVPRCGNTIVLLHDGCRSRHYASVFLLSNYEIVGPVRGLSTLAMSTVFSSICSFCC